MIDTIKFSQMTDGGDIDNGKKTPGLKSNANVLFNNPWTFLPSGTTAQRPTPAADMYNRLRFNTEDQLYEYYDSVAMVWTQLQESSFTAGPFIIYEADASIPGAQNLGLLGDGVLKQTVLAGSATLTVEAPQALTKIDDFNVTLTLNGTPLTSLLEAVELVLGWTGVLGIDRGGLNTGTIPTNGQIPIGNGADYTLATLTAGPGVSITNAPGSVTIAGTGSGIGWTEVTGTTQAMTADSGWVTNNGALVTLTLPATAAFGTAISVIGKGAGGWQIAQNAGQNIQVGDFSSTVGAGGFIASTNRYDSIDLICTTANTTWTVLGGPQSAAIVYV
jgi:hypothetical protein